MTIEFSSRYDGNGFYYGDVGYMQINLLPPEPEWKGDVQLTGDFAPGEDWKIFIDGVQKGTAQSFEAAKAEAEKLVRLIDNN